jgi:lipid-A-disaccharide synthase
MGNESLDAQGIAEPTVRRRTSSGTVGTAAYEKRIFLVAGEESGDQLGGGVIEALRAEDPDVLIAGVGGRSMTAAGLTSLFPMTDLAVMGIGAVLGRLPLLLKRMKETVRAILDFRPDVLVIIDSPDFTHRVARRVRAQRPLLPVVNYVSPTVWAWRTGRAAKMRAYIDHVLALFPFEPDAYRRLHGPPCTYVGHSLVERLQNLTPSAEELRARSADRPLVVLLPGSRHTEITRLLADFGAALPLIQAGFGPFESVIPAVPHLEGAIREAVTHWPIQPRIVTTEQEKFAAFRSARAALAASGTVTLELALAGVPQCVAYKVSWLESFLRYFIKVPTIVLPNLILGEISVPEFLQDHCTPINLAESMIGLLRGGREREIQAAAFPVLAAKMTAELACDPARTAARIISTHAARGA